MDADLLAGIRVLDFGIWRPGPYATQLLVELGADVLKVEPPGGDPMRAFPDLFETLNANKRGIALDLKEPEARARARGLAAEADVLVEGYRPGVAARLGIGDEDVRAVNPSIIYCSISGYGQDGPLARAPGHDLNYEAIAGALIPRDAPDPVHPGVPIADLAAGAFGALAVCAALTRRARTGEGDRIDIAMADVLASWTGAFPEARVAGAAEAIRGGTPSYGIFETSDRKRLTIAIVAEDHFWRNLCDVLGLEGVRDLGMVERLERSTELRALIEAAVARHSRDDLVERLLAADVPAAPVLTPAEMLRHPHFLARGTVTRSAEGPPVIASPLRFERTPTRTGGRAPALDEHRGQGFPAP